MLQIAAAYHPLFRALGLTSAQAFVDYFCSPDPSGGTSVNVRPVTLEPAGHPRVDVFYKQYEYQPASWLFFARPSKARCEYLNYDVFHRLDIPCADPIAVGEQRDALGRLRRAFIITRAIPDALTLTQFVEQQAAGSKPIQAAAKNASGQRERVVLRRQLARLTRRIHDAGFFHHDLHWRNVLITTGPGADPKVWWIDCPRGGFNRWTPWRRWRGIKDLACLDKTASQCCSRRERISFIREYLDEPRLSPAGKQIIRTVLAYRKSRWPKDWRGV